MSLAAVVAFLFAWICIAVSFLLGAYLALRIHALVRSGDLPKETLKWFRGRWSYNVFFLGYGSDLKFLCSPKFRDIDSHTRRLTPIIRVAAVLGVVGFIAFAVLVALG